MGSMQIVFLFDLNACSDFLSKPKEELSKKLLSVRLACLRILTDLSSKSPNLKWGLKFFDSRGSKTQSMPKFSFSDLTLENFETLENEIIVRYERHLSLMQALAESSQKTEVSANTEKDGKISSEPPVKVLQLAMTQILCEFQWETMDMWSPSIAKLRSRTFGRINFLFVFSEFKDDDAFLYEYFQMNSSISRPKFLNAFLPQSLRDSIVKKSDIHLVLLNTCLEQKFMGSPTSKLLPLLSHSLQAVQGSLIPLSILSQPSYNLKLPEKLAVEDNSSIPTLCNSYRNSLIPFSILFEQSLNQPFYSSMNTSAYDCCIEFPNKDEIIQIQVTEICKKPTYVNTNMCKDGNNARVSSSKKKNSSEEKSVVCSKFVVHFSLPRKCHFPSKEMFLCLPNNSKSVAGSLTSLNKNLHMEEINLVVECVSESGIKMLGMLTPLSYDCAVILILDPSVKFSQLESESKLSVSSSTKDRSQVNYLVDEMKDIKNLQKIEPESLSNHSVKAFQVEYVESWFKPTPEVSKATVEAEPSNSALKMESYWQLLKQSVQHSKSAKVKCSRVKQNLNNGAITNSEKKETSEKSEGDQTNENQTKDIDEKLLDLSYEELLSATRDIYNSAIESSSDIVSPSNRLVKIIVNYCKKQCDNSPEEKASNILKDNLLVTARKIIEKYENDDSQQATENKIKECQMQVLLMLGVENLKACADRSNCVNNVTSLLRLMIFYNGVKESQHFLHEVLQKNFGNNLYDILVEIGDELDIPIFDDADSSNSPAETTSSELNNDDDIFSSIMSSNISEKSSSSTSSRKGKENKDNVVDRKLSRRRSDISDTSRHRQVILPRSSKKRKVKAGANKALRYSPRLAAKKNEQDKSLCEKTNKVCRNLFSTEKVQCTPKKNAPSTPKGNKVGNCSSNVLYVPSTPFEKQNHSALERKILNDQLSNSPKIYISPKINKTAKDGSSKKLMERLEKVALERRANNNNIKVNTPESNRRLSLKMHSKQFSSPTARLGLKKCMKRLFDQISPAKNESNKRHKPDEECNVSSPLEKDIS